MVLEGDGDPAVVLRTYRVTSSCHRWVQLGYLKNFQIILEKLTLI